MALTGQQFIDEALNQVGRPGTTELADGSTDLETLALRWVNYAQERIANIFAFQELDSLTTGVTLVANQKVYTDTELLGATKAAKLKQYLSVRYIDATGTASRKLTYRHYRKYDQDFPNPIDLTTREPTIYVPYGRGVEIFPIPDDTYTLDIRASLYPTDLTLLTISEYIKKDDIIVADIIRRYYNFAKQPKDAVRWNGEFKRLLAESIEHVSDRSDWEPEGRGFGSSNTPFPPGEYWNNPFVGSGDYGYGYDYYY